MVDWDDTIFMLPGPVKMHRRVTEAMSIPAFAHRTADFREVIKEIKELLFYLFQVSPETWEVTPISGSGTAGVDSVLVNLLKPGDKVICPTNGKFGERLYEISHRYTRGSAIQVKASEWGQPFDLGRIEELLSEGDVKAITLCHNETSAGATNPAKEIGELAKKYGAMFILDGITSVGGLPVIPDELHADVVIVGSQKCIGAPAGMAAVAVRKDVEDKFEHNSYYLDLLAHIEKMRKNDTPYTPAIPLFFAFREALRLVKEEGLENRWEKNRIMAEATRAAIKALGLELFPHPDLVSNTLTAIWYPEGIKDEDVRGKLAQKYNIIVAGAQAHIKGKVFRIGHMGSVGWSDLMATIAALEAVLMEAGYRKFDPGDGVGAMLRVMEKEGVIGGDGAKA